METELRKRLKTEFVGAEITLNVDGNRVAIQIVADIFDCLL